MAGFAAMGTLDIWYAHLDEDEFLKAVQSAADEASKASKKAAKTAKRVAKGAQQGRRQGAHPRQPAGAVQAR